jgi:hypothetical protein
MKNPIQKALLPVSLLAFLASFSLPALRADDASASTVGSISEASIPSADAAAKTPDSAQTDAAKKGKKKHGGKKKHPKKSKAAATSDSSSPGAAAAPAADAAK